MKTLTKQQLLSLRPCYTPEQIDELWGDRESATAREIATAPIPMVDRLWVLIRVLPAREQRLFACDCAKRVLRHYEYAYPDDTRPREAIEVSRRYVMGTATEEELYAAARAAGEASEMAETDCDGSVAADDASGAALAALNAVRAASSVNGAAGHAVGAVHNAAWAARAQAAEHEWQVGRALWYFEQGESA